MSGARALRSSEGNYTIVANHFAQRKELSARSVGIVTYALSCHPDKRHSAETLSEHFSEGRDAIAKSLRELASCGYYRTLRYQAEGGRWATDTFISDQPITDELLERVTGRKIAKAQVSPTTVFQGSVPPAQTDISAGQPDNGFSGLGPTSTNTPSAQVAPSPEKPKPGFSGDKIFKTLEKENPPLPPSEPEPAAPSPVLKKAGEGEAQARIKTDNRASAENFASVLLAQFDQENNSPLRRAKLADAAEQLMNQGASVAWLRGALTERNFDGVRDPGAALIARASKLSYDGPQTTVKSTHTPELAPWRVDVPKPTPHGVQRAVDLFAELGLRPPRALIKAART